MIRNAFHRLKEQALAESTREYKARGILVKRCNGCQLNPELCICALQPNLSTNIDFILIYHRDEIFKPSNTGRLIADTFPQNTYAFCWNRKTPPPELLSLLNDKERRCVIVYPAESSESRRINSSIEQQENKRLTLILLDATWRQSRRMYNFSQWLKDFEVLKINPARKSHYLSRNAADDSYLSTAESAGLALSSCGQEHTAKKLFDYFYLFNQRYSMMRSNHKLSSAQLDKKQ
ncbi:tRNA-uridine aminocarboxypropyltransferase [Aliikangiella sp. G2MR2-5]|uniref:tRNA-uridine aminocarboxypropyltransferase n=1 Tax=Aliikangiella sp. G2MR2-5 TaxID=2788943 RepID=UPI0018A99C6B|nr:DTW domain-containing protein [Aliikangiella sp. G2MR2-5]